MILLSPAGADVSGRLPIVFAQGFQADIIGLILHSGPLAQVVLLILGFFSVMSWAIMAERHRAISRAEKEDRTMATALRSQASLADVRDACERLPYSPMAHIFRAGFREVTRAVSPHRAGGGGVATATEAGVSAGSAVRAAERAMVSASSEALGNLEKYLSFLASTAAATPFIGLFGTVWGIMNAFRAIGLIGTANLATVAPGISEALIATAAGLAAAIPAVLGYNYLNNRLRAMGNRLDNFIAESLNRFESVG